MVVGPWFHGDSDGLDLAAEHLRWYDYWLKGIDNGVMAEPPIHYFTIDAPQGSQWRETAQWPLPNQQLTEYYFARDEDDRRLSLDPPVAGNDNRDVYAVDYSTSSGTTNRWANANGGVGAYPDMAPNDEKCLTYTTAPLEHPVEITGHPIVHLWLGSSADDVDIFVLLEDIDPVGRSHYVTEGMLRASNRALGEAPWNNIGLPHHPGTRNRQQPVGDQPIELVLDLHPTSKRFRTGHRIRVAIAGCDIDNCRTPILSPPPTLMVHRTPEQPSRIILPIIPG